MHSGKHDATLHAPERRSILYNLQALRAIAAMLVIFPHLGSVLAPTGWTEDDMAFGQYGVDLFFVISGFVMVHTCDRKSLGPLMFMLNRIIRIVPLYWTLTAAAFIGALITPSVFVSTTADKTALVKSLLFLPFMKGNGLIRPVLHVGWTLNYEMFFYAIFAASLAVSRRSVGLTVATTSCILLLLVALGQIWPPTRVLAIFYTNPILITFIYGMSLGWMYDRQMVEMPTLTAFTLLVIGFLTLLTHRYILLTGNFRPILAGFPSLVIVFSVLALERNGYFLSWRWVQMLGAASYSLYLSHPFFAQAIGLASRRIATPVISYLLAAVVLIVAPLIATALYLLFEKPVASYLRRLIREPAPLIERAV